MKLLIFSDLHGNQAAFAAVVELLTGRLLYAVGASSQSAEPKFLINAKSYCVSDKIPAQESNQTVNVLPVCDMYFGLGACLLLGDLIDYGPHSNEVIQMVKTLPYPILCSLRGNHEDAILRDTYDRFSSDRGRESARYTRSVLNDASWEYLRNGMESCGKKEFMVGTKKCLAVHGSLGDEYWKSIRPEDDLSAYSGYDYVFSGHSHLPHFFEKYYPCDDERHRNKKKTIFINPGSVGQPRNLNPAAQFAIFNTETEQVIFEKVNYDIGLEQSFYHGQVDDFYRERLKWGV